MHCTNCGRQVPKGSKFCEVCGTPIAAEETMPVTNWTSPPPAPAPPRATRHRGRTLLIVLLTMFLTLGATVGVGYWVWSSPPTVEPSSVETFIAIPGE